MLQNDLITHGLIMAELAADAAPPQGAHVALEYVEGHYDNGERVKVTRWSVDPDGAWLVNAIYEHPRESEVTVMFVNPDILDRLGLGPPASPNVLPFRRRGSVRGGRP